VILVTNYNNIVTRTVAHPYDAFDRWIGRKHDAAARVPRRRSKPSCSTASTLPCRSAARVAPPSIQRRRSIAF